MNAQWDLPSNSLLSLLYMDTLYKCNYKLPFIHLEEARCSFLVNFVYFIVAVVQGSEWIVLMVSW